MSENGETRLPMLQQTKAALSRSWAFVSRHLSVSEAHTVEFYSRGLWRSYLGDAEPQTVQLLLMRDSKGMNLGQAGTPREGGGAQGIGGTSSAVMDIEHFLHEAQSHTLPGLGICVSTDEAFTMFGADGSVGIPVRPEDFMSTKKSHEVELMSRMVVTLALKCNVSQVIDLGSGKGYLSSYLSMQFGLRVFGIDSSAVNTRGAAERNRKLGKFWKGYKKRASKPEEKSAACSPGPIDKSNTCKQQTRGAVIKLETANDFSSSSTIEVCVCKQGTFCNEGTVNGCKETSSDDHMQSYENGSSLTESMQNKSAGTNVKPEEGLAASSELNYFLNNREGVALSIGTDVSPEGDLLLKELTEITEVQDLRPKDMSVEERARRKQVNLEAKSSKEGGVNAQTLLTCWITPDTEIEQLITGMETGLLVGLHTCGDLAATTLRLFAGRAALRGVCSVGCCYHLLTEPSQLHSSPAADDGSRAYGFPMSDHLKSLHCTIGRNSRMSACLAPERVTSGKGLLTESLFYRAVLQVLIEDHYGSLSSTKRVGKTYGKSTSFLDYTRKALQKLELDDSKLSDADIQDYYSKFLPRLPEMEAFNMLKVILAPCVEGIILMDRLCFLLEQDCVSQAALVQMFHPLTSPRCYALVATRR
ncbi:putative methyltransferase-like protein 25 [Petromyzon marinus]|uniref:putative methyltransferase-like protein 25 n=1 Tax=Petromyzon marinus TaxID=7757 RepID=UPI003F6F4BB3